MIETLSVVLGVALVAIALLVFRLWRAGEPRDERSGPAPVVARDASQLATHGGVAGGQVAVGSVQGDVIVAWTPRISWSVSANGSRRRI